MRRALLTALLAFVLPAAAQAGGAVTLGCKDGSWQQEFLVGSGQQLHGQGLEVWPMYCPATGQMSSYARILDEGRFMQLEQLAAKKVKDNAKIRDYLELSAQFGNSEPLQFPGFEELTFADIRNTVKNAARNTGEKIPPTNVTAYSHPACQGKLVPFDYYLDSKAPYPGCNGQPLERIETGRRIEWD